MRGGFRLILGSPPGLEVVGEAADGVRRPSELERLDAVGGLPHHLEPGELEDQPEAAAHRAPGRRRSGRWSWQREGCVDLEAALVARAGAQLAAVDLHPLAHSDEAVARARSRWRRGRGRDASAAAPSGSHSSCTLRGRARGRACGRW